MPNLPKRIEIKITIEHCDQCPHHEDFVGDKFCKKFEKANGEWRHITYKDERHNFPLWCPLIKELE